MRVRWSTEAAGDLDRIASEIAKDRPASALAVARKIYRTAASLSRQPRRGRRGWLEGTRELVLTPLPFIIVYRTIGETVQILRVYHGAQNWRRDDEGDFWV